VTAHLPENEKLYYDRGIVKGDIMNSTDVESQAPHATQPAQTTQTAETSVAPMGLCSSQASCKSADASSCGTGGCSSSNYTAKAFFIPFLAVTAYSVIQGNSCAATSGHACTASAVAVGVLAGLTSVALVKTIKALRKTGFKS
jgi:hypothetical protein